MHSNTFTLRARVLFIPPVPTGVYPLQPSPSPTFNPVSPRVFQISRLAPQYDKLFPLRGNFATFTRDEFLSCDTFLRFFYFVTLWVLLFWCFCNDTTCPLLEIHDVTWGIRLIGASWVLTIFFSFSICLINSIGVS